MAHPRKNSRRQRLIGLRTDSYAVFPKALSKSVRAQLHEISRSTGLHYQIITTPKTIHVKKLNA